jgi:shikimate dehydrogenase
MPDSYAVIGNPVAHSGSPRIHAEFARQTGEDPVYDRLLAPLDGFTAIASAFRTRAAQAGSTETFFVRRGRRRDTAPVLKLLRLTDAC